MEYFQLDAADFEDGRICEVAFQTELCNGQPFGKLVVGGAGYHAGAQQAGGRAAAEARSTSRRASMRQRHLRRRALYQRRNERTSQLRVRVRNDVTVSTFCVYKPTFVSLTWPGHLCTKKNSQVTLMYTHYGS